MFNKGVQTYLESNFSVPFVPTVIKRSFSELSRPWRYELRELCFGHHILNNHFLKQLSLEIISCEFLTFNLK